MFVIIGDKTRAATDSGKNLCLTCRDYRSMTYALDDREERLCTRNDQHPLRLRGPVSHCSDYHDRTKPSRWEMDKMAWAIEPAKQVAGFRGTPSVKFVPPSERKDIDQ